MSKSTSIVRNSSNQRRRARNIPLVEPLESRRMLSADPAVIFAGLPPAALKTEGKTRIALRVQNDGDAPASGSGKIELFASTDTNLDGGDLLLGTINKRFKVKPTKGVSVKVPVSALHGLPSGDYHLIARLSGKVAAADTNSVNNQAAAPSSTRVEDRFVDLAAEFPALAIQPASGGANQISVAAANLGNITARGQVQVSLYLSADTTLDSGDMLISARPPLRARIAPGKAQTFSTNVVLPANTPLGTYHVIAKIISGGGITDTNAANDVGVAQQTVDVVNQPPAPQPRDDDGAPDIVVVEYVVPVGVPVGGYYAGGGPDDGSADGTTVQMPDDGSSDDGSGDGQPIEQPPQYVPDPQPDPTPPVYNPPTQPPVQYDPPATQPEPEPQPPATQPVIDEPPPAVDTGYYSSGGDF